MRAGVSADGTRLLYVSMAARAPAPLLTVVALPGGERVADFLLDSTEARARGERIVREGGYVEARGALPEGIRIELTRGAGGWEGRLLRGREVRALTFGAHFLSILDAFAVPSLKLHGVSEDGRWALYEVRDASDTASIWPRSVIAIALR